MSSVVIRRAKSSDDQVLGELLVHSFVSTYADKMPEVVVHDARKEDLRDVASKRESAVVLVAEIAGKIAGTVTLFPPGHPQSKTWKPGYFDLRYMAVATEFHSQGIAQALLDETQRVAREAGAQGITLHVRHGAWGVAKTYRRHGWIRAREGDQDRRPEILLDGYEWNGVNSFPALIRGRPAVLLAPMEGVTDAPMREVLTRFGSFTFCVSEFLRVSETPVSQKVFIREVPESRSMWRTSWGTHVQPQLLGGHPERIAISAQFAVNLGARAIDLNFGCPAPTVNRNDGGATLLKFPERIYDIVRAVRAAVSREIPVSAKLRLGWDNPQDVLRNAEEACRGGASWITLHARTRMQGYAPPADWKWVGDVVRSVSIPVVANGDIWTFEDWKRCQEITGCEHYMIGRPALANPFLVNEITSRLGISDRVSLPQPLDGPGWFKWLSQFHDVALSKGLVEAQILARGKQWLRMANAQRPLAFFDQVKLARTWSEFCLILDAA